MKFLLTTMAVLACTGFLLAQESAAPNTETTIMGSVISIDAVTNTIIVKEKKGEDTISVESGAKIVRGKKNITLGDMKTGSKATVIYTTIDGMKMASKIIEKISVSTKKKKTAAK